MKWFLLGFVLPFIVVLVPEIALAAPNTAITFEESAALNEELYTVITYTGAVLVFIGGWIVGSMT